MITMWSDGFSTMKSEYCKHSATRVFHGTFQTFIFQSACRSQAQGERNFTYGGISYLCERKAYFCTGEYEGRPMEVRLGGEQESPHLVRVKLYRHVDSEK